MNKALWMLTAYLSLVILAGAGVPPRMNYQGFLADNSGAPLDTVVGMTFQLYSAAVGGAPLWTETQPSCSVRAGIFSVKLGSVAAIPDSFNRAEVWLGITVGANSEMTPRMQYVSVPYAYRVGTVDGASGGEILGPVQIDTTLQAQGIRFNDGTVQWTAVDTANYASRAWTKSMGYLRGLNNVAHDSGFVGGGDYNFARGRYSVVAGGGGSVVTDSNSASGTCSIIGGGRRNQASEFGAVVGGGRSNLATQSYTTISGGGDNQAVATYSTISGGRLCRTEGNYSAVGGGYSNSTAGSYSTIGGGHSNSATGGTCSISGGYGNKAIGDYSTIGGGYSNTARGFSSVVSGGGGPAFADSNVARGNWSAIGGGAANYADSLYSVISGGHANLATAYYASVGGGDQNRATGNYSTANGGYSNTASGGFTAIGGGSQNSATSYGSTVGGGSSNSTSGNNATVGGGSSNSANGFWATVPGGNQNAANGNYSLAAGRMARANYFGSFVWGDATADTIADSSANEVRMRASGGAWIYSDSLLTDGVVLRPGTNCWAPIDATDSCAAGNGQMYADTNTYDATRTWVRSNGHLRGANNVVSATGFVGGGDFNFARGDYSVVSGGGGSTAVDSNSATGYRSVIGGGANNTASNSLATVVGGWVNTASGYSAIVGGGAQNTASGDGATIGGGAFNTASGIFATTGGGSSNTANGTFAAVGGGTENTAGDHATVGGGARNTGGFQATVGGGTDNTAIGENATVGGGRYNKARGAFSTVGGGGGVDAADSNSAIGHFSTVPGGRGNVASSWYSFAAGHRAKANHQGCFVWGDAPDSDFSSTAANQFLIRAGGGVGINLNNPAEVLEVNGDIKADTFCVDAGVRFPDGSFQSSAAFPAHNHYGAVWSGSDSADALKVINNYRYDAAAGHFITTPNPGSPYYQKIGVIGEASDSTNGYNYFPASIGVKGFAKNFQSEAIGVYGEGRGTRGIWHDEHTSIGVFGRGTNEYIGGNAVGGYFSADTTAGYFGTRTSVWGVATVGLAGKFTGDVQISGYLSKGGGSFLIDHPLDPENKYLYHSFVESPDMKNIYDGVIELNGYGEAIVELPNYFEALNKDFRYQLTCIGAFAQVYVAQEISGNQFRIAGGKPGMKVSWQVTGTRRDAFANAHRIIPEVDKKPEDKGKYLYPKEHSKPENYGIDWERIQTIERSVKSRKN